MRDEDRELVRELRRIGTKPCLAMAAFFEEADADPERVLARAREARLRVPEVVSGDAMEPLLEEARAIARELLQDAADKAETARALAARGAIDELVEAGEAFLYDGDVASARSAFASAVERTEAAYGTRSRELVVPLMGLARASGETSRPEELAIQRRALSIAEETLAPDDILLAECLQAFGVSTWGAGEPDVAAGLLARSLEVTKRAGADPSPYLAPLVGALVDAKRPADALPHARELLRLEGGGESLDLTTLFVVGQALLEAGARAEARAVLTRFLSVYGEGGNPAIVDQVRRWLDDD